MQSIIEQCQELLQSQYFNDFDRHFWEKKLQRFKTDAVRKEILSELRQSLEFMLRCEREGVPVQRLTKEQAEAIADAIQNAIYEIEDLLDPISYIGKTRAQLIETIQRLQIIETRKQ